jgi:hypothetical protein
MIARALRFALPLLGFALLLFTPTFVGRLTSVATGCCDCHLPLSMRLGEAMSIAGASGKGRGPQRVCDVFRK